MNREQARSTPRNQARKLAEGLGWFSIALGAVEMAAPQALSRWLGMKDSELVLQAYGVREIATGIGILASDNPTGWVWGRVAGDGPGHRHACERPQQGRRQQGKHRRGRCPRGSRARRLLRAESRPERAGPGETASAHYGDRSGFPQPAGEMRGAARSFEIPADMRTPELMRPLTTG